MSWLCMSYCLDADTCIGHQLSMLPTFATPAVSPQALLDVYTIKREIGRLENFSIGLVGDLANGRTVRSLAYLLSMYPGVKMYFVAPEVVCMKDDIKQYLDRCARQSCVSPTQTDKDRRQPEYAAFRKHPCIIICPAETTFGPLLPTE